MSKATYYIEVDTYWQNSKSYFVGPFESRETSEAWVHCSEWTPEDNIWLSTSMCGGSTQDAWRVYPASVSKTEARKLGMRSFACGDERDNTLPPTTHASANALSDAVADLKNMPY